MSVPLSQTCQNSYRISALFHKGLWCICADMCSHGPLHRAFHLIQTGLPSTGELHPMVQIRAASINNTEQIFWVSAAFASFLPNIPVTQGSPHQCWSSPVQHFSNLPVLTSHVVGGWGEAYSSADCNVVDVRLWVSKSSQMLLLQSEYKVWWNFFSYERILQSRVIIFWLSLYNWLKRFVLNNNNNKP